MTVSELIEALNDYASMQPGDPKVRLISNKNYPMEYGIAGVACSDDFDEPPDDPVLYIVEGGQIGYGSANAWDRM